MELEAEGTHHAFVCMEETISICEVGRCGRNIIEQRGARARARARVFLISSDCMLIKSFL